MCWIKYIFKGNVLPQHSHKCPGLSLWTGRRKTVNKKNVRIYSWWVIAWAWKFFMGNSTNSHIPKGQFKTIVYQIFKRTRHHLMSWWNITLWPNSNSGSSRNTQKQYCDWNVLAVHHLSTFGVLIQCRFPDGVEIALCAMPKPLFMFGLVMFFEFFPVCSLKRARGPERTPAMEIVHTHSLWIYIYWLHIYNLFPYRANLLVIFRLSSPDA